METKELEKTEDKPLATIRDLFAKNRAQLEMAMPKHMNIDRMLGLALTACQRNPKLLECHPATLGGAILMCATWGVEPIGAGGAWLVPFMNNKKNRLEVQFIIDYRGLVKIAKNSGEVNKVEWHPVHKKDSFSCQYGTSPQIHHIPWTGEGDAGEVTHVYAVGFLKDGTSQFVVMPKSEALKAKSRSKATYDGPWVTDEVEMMLKTSVRRLCKQLPMQPEKQVLIEREERGDLGLPQDLGTLIDHQETETNPAGEGLEPKPTYEMPKEVEPEGTAQEPVETGTQDGAFIPTEVKEHNGVAKKTGKPFKKWAITLPDGRQAGTFSETFAEIAMEAKAKGSKIVVEVEANGQYWNAKNVTAA